MDFIFMLTRDDLTVENCLEIFETVRPLGIRHVGCKDVGVEPAVLRQLVQRIRGSGAVSYLEVVSTSPEECLRSARAAVQVGVDCLMGGTEVEETLAILRGSGIRYHPFPGIPIGHPTRLGGTPQRIAADCRRFQALGCAGVDLLAYRATEADPIALVRAARRATQGYLIAAGSVDSPQRIRALREEGCDAFTVGSAVFQAAFAPRKGGVVAQLEQILACLA